jgi:hypothetical protein
MEVTAGRRVQRARHLALQHDALAPRRENRSSRPPFRKFATRLHGLPMRERDAAFRPGRDHPGRRRPGARTASSTSSTFRAGLAHGRRRTKSSSHTEGDWLSVTPLKPLIVTAGSKIYASGGREKLTANRAVMICPARLSYE